MHGAITERPGCAKVGQCTTARTQEVERLRRQSRGAIVESRVGNSGREGGGTSPRMGEIERSRMPEPRATHGAVAEEARTELPSARVQPSSIPNILIT